MRKLDQNWRSQGTILNVLFVGNIRYIRIKLFVKIKNVMEAKKEPK